MKLAERTTRIAGSPTMKVTATVDRLRREGVQVIDFGAGEPDFNTPDAVKGAAHQALHSNFTRYTPVPGIIELKRAICARYKADYGVESFSDLDKLFSNPTLFSKLAREKDWEHARHLAAVARRLSVIEPLNLSAKDLKDRPELEPALRAQIDMKAALREPTCIYFWLPATRGRVLAAYGGVFVAGSPPGAWPRTATAPAGTTTTTSSGAGPPDRGGCHQARLSGPRSAAPRRTIGANAARPRCVRPDGAQVRRPTSPTVRKSGSSQVRLRIRLRFGDDIFQPPGNGAGILVNGFQPAE